jgi:ABC-2 type transport system ATP-binding protein
LEPFLSFQGVEKRFGEKIVFSSFHLVVEKGDWVLIRGRNGSGKTTLLRLAGGILRPDKGEIRFSGERIGYQGDKALFPRSMTVKEIVSFHRKLFPTAVEEEESFLFSRLDLSPYLSFPLSSLSAGIEKRVLFFCAFRHHPDLLLLDEVETHLDEEGREVIFSILRRYNEEGGTILMATHTFFPAGRIREVHLS